MTFPETFFTAHLTAERLRKEHLIYLCQLHQHPQVMNHLGGIRSVEKTQEVLKAHLDRWDTLGYGPWLLRDRTSGEFAGIRSLREEEIQGRAELVLGCLLLPAFWGRGLATETAQALLHFVDVLLPGKEVVAFTDIRNVASQRVLEKVGFRLEYQGVYANEPHLFYRWNQHVSREGVGKKEGERLVRRIPR